jgi:hypothetical protein
MKIIVRLEDIWRNRSSRRQVVRSGVGTNKFCLISSGTGQSTNAMTAKEIFDYLVWRKNPIECVFLFEMNLSSKFEEILPNFHHFGGLYVWGEEVEDKDLLNLRDEEAAFTKKEDERIEKEKLEDPQQGYLDLS